MLQQEAVCAAFLRSGAVVQSACSKFSAFCAALLAQSGRKEWCFNNRSARTNFASPAGELQPRAHADACNLRWTCRTSASQGPVEAAQVFPRYSIPESY